MLQRIIVRRLLTAGAVAAVLATGPAQAREGPGEVAKVWHWLASLQDNVHRALRFWPEEAVRGKQGHLIDPNGSPAPNSAGSPAPSCEGCTEAGLLIDPNG